MGCLDNSLNCFLNSSNCFKIYLEVGDKETSQSLSWKCPRKDEQTYRLNEPRNARRRLMGFGFSKVFAVILIIGVAYAYWLRSINGFFVVIIPFAIGKIIWNMMTQR